MIIYSLKVTGRTLYGALVVGGVAVAGCGGGGGAGQPAFTYSPIAAVPQAVNDLGRLIDQDQRSVVTPGGDQWRPGFSAVDQQRFDSSNRLASIVQQFKSSPTFISGVASIKGLTPDVQETVYAAYSKPLYPTWAMNGVISSAGTTDAGYAVEGEIAAALTKAVQDAVAN